METTELKLVIDEKSNSVIECPHCYAKGLQVEFVEHYSDNWKEYKCKVCNEKFLCK